MTVAEKPARGKISKFLFETPWEKAVEKAENRVGRKLSEQELKPLREFVDRKENAYGTGMAVAGATMIATAPVLGPAAIVAGITAGKLAHKISAAKREERLETAINAVVSVAEMAIGSVAHIKAPDDPLF